MDVWTIYFIWGIAALVTSLPFTLLCIRSTPQECGQLPYGEPENKSGKPAGIDASKAMKSAVFYACFLFAGLINLLTIVAQQFPSYTKSLTNVPFDALAVGVMMATVMMVAQAVFKLMLGVAADKNARATFVAAIVTGIAGILLVWFGTGSEAILYTGAAVYGFFFASCVVFVPVFVRQIFGQREYPEIYSRISLFVNIMGAVGPVFWAFLGSFGYSTLFMVAIVLLVLIFVLGWFCFARMKSVREQWTE
jgi:MFS family permease